MTGKEYYLLLEENKNNYQKIKVAFWQVMRGRDYIELCLMVYFVINDIHLIKKEANNCSLPLTMKSIILKCFILY